MYYGSLRAGEGAFALGVSKAERVATFLSRLDRAPAAHDRASAFRLVADTLNAVEDEFSNVPFDPSSHADDGRLYPPQSDAQRSVPGRTDLVRYRSKGHNIYVANNGAIRIDTAGGSNAGVVCCLNKAGADGRTMELGE